MPKIGSAFIFYKIIGISLCLSVCFSFASGQSNSKRLFPIYENGKAGFIDKTGKIIIPLKLDKASDFSEELARVEINNKLGFINPSGKVVFFLPPFIDTVLDFSDGLAAIQINKKWGYIDTSGNIAIQPVYDQTYGFVDGVAQVSSRFNSVTKDAYIDKEGSIVIGFQGFNYLNFSDGLAFDRNQKSFIDRKGNIVINKDVYTDAERFSEGLAAVEINDKWGFINKTGKLMIDPQFDWAGNFSEGLAPVRFDKRNVIIPTGKNKGIEVVSNAYGYIDKTGKIVIEPQFIGHEPPYDDNLPIGSFSEGLAKFKDVFTHKWGFINRTGQIVIEAQFDDVNDFVDGLAFVEIDEKRGYIEKSGKYIWKEKDDKND